MSTVMLSQNQDLTKVCTYTLAYCKTTDKHCIVLNIPYLYGVSFINRRRHIPIQLSIASIWATRVSNIISGVAFRQSVRSALTDSLKAKPEIMPQRNKQK